MSESDYERYYKYEPRLNGIATFTITIAQPLESYTQVQYELYDARKQLIDQTLMRGDGGKTPEHIVLGGNKYYIKLTGMAPDNQYIKYSINVFRDSYEYVEGRSAAKDNLNETPLVRNKTFIGISGPDDEHADFYSVTAPADGYAKISVDRDPSTKGSPVWDVYAIDGDSRGQLYKLSTTYRKDTKNTHQLYHALKKGKSVIINVGYANEDAKNAKYNISFTFVKTKDIESSSNDVSPGSEKLVVNRKKYGSLAEEKSGDFFYLEPKKSGKYKVSLSLDRKAVYGYKLTVSDYLGLPIVSKTPVKKKGTITFKAKKGRRYYVSIVHASPDKGYSIAYLYKLKVSGPQKKKKK